MDWNKNCTGVELWDVIMDVKLKFEKKPAILMSLEVKIRLFLLVLHVGLTTVQRCRAACDQ